MNNIENVNAFWNVPLQDLQTALGLESGGITSAEAQARAMRWGPNVLQGGGGRGMLVQYFLHFKNPLVLILLAASLVSFVTGEITGFAIIWLILLFSVTLDFYQEYRASRAAEQLKQSVEVQATALRDGRPQSLPMSQLVPGDVVLLSAGDLMPADCRLIEAKDFFVNQSLLTGESYPVEKHACDLPAPKHDLSEISNSVFMGTSVISGMASAFVCRTGTDTAVGEIAHTLESSPPPTSFSRGTHQFGMLIMRLTILLVLFVFLVNTLAHRPLLESFLFAIALAVGLTPELLPMVVTVTLSRGAMRMAHRKVIVKQLAAIHNLGSMDILCTDKTGTLTEAHIRLIRHLDAFGRESEQVLKLAWLNSHFETGIKSPLDEAILAHQTIDVGSWRKIDEVPFDFERRRVSVLLDDGVRRMLVVKGAPEDIMRLCTHCSSAGDKDAVQLDEKMRHSIARLHDDLSREGFRLLGIAWRKVATDHPHAVVGDESELVFAGFAAFLDPPKQSAARAIRDLSDSGVGIKVITGDGELITRHVFASLGMPVTGILTGAEIDRLDDHALAARVREANLMCRLNPSQKNRVILALKSQGHTVGYLGDGINDAPSLQSADVGISVDSAADVAKAAAHMILLEQDLGVLHAGVMEGRRTHGNIMKYLMMGTSSNFGNMFSMAGATLFLAFLPMLPVQILLNNLLYDLSELPIPMDRVDEEYLGQPRHWDTSFIRNYMLIMGPVSSLFDFLTFFILLKVFHAGEALFHTGWFVESLATQVLVIFVIRTRGNPLLSKPSLALALTSAAVFLVALWLPYSPLSAQFGFVPLPASFHFILLALVAAYLATMELTKRWFYRKYSMPGFPSASHASQRIDPS